MLVLSRHKNEEVYITIGDKLVKVVVVDIRGDKIRLGFEADLDVGVFRKEVYEAIGRAKEKLDHPTEQVENFDITKPW